MSEDILNILAKLALEYTSTKMQLMYFPNSEIGELSPSLNGSKASKIERKLKYW